MKNKICEYDLMNVILKGLILILIIICFEYYNKYIKISEPMTSVLSNSNKKDWLDEIFDMRQIITISSRKKNVSLFCKSLEINETIFNAILKADISYNNVYNLKIGEIACAMSQEAVLRKFVESDAKSLMLFEDDVMPINHEVYTNSGITLNHIKKYIEKCVQNLPSNWDVIYFGRCWDNCSKHITINKYLVKVHRAMCHHAIVFSKKGAQRILESIKHPLSKPIDHIVSGLCVSGELHAYASKTPVFYQNRDQLSTTIGNFDSLPVCA